MKLKKGLLKESRLYVIIDKSVLKNRALSNITRKIKDKGCDIIQFRDKVSGKETVLECAQILRKILLNSKTLFIVNDYIDIAKIIDADGVHLGWDDLPLEIARSILGKNKIIGLSCHNLNQAVEAQNRGADYISIGPIFSSPTKPQYKAIGLDLIKECREKIKIPFFAIGGISLNNIDLVLSSGAKRIAVCRAVCQAKNIPHTIKNLSEAITYGSSLERHKLYG